MITKQGETQLKAIIDGVKIDEFIMESHIEIAGQRVKTIEQHICFLTKPCPKMIPPRVWRWLISKVIVIQETHNR